ncbi:hypothetical protein RFI_18523, partial [Reticulomyxa filosa]
YRVYQVFTFAYHRLAFNLDFYRRRDECYFFYAVQLTPIPTCTYNVTRTHNLLDIVIDCYMHFLCNSVPANLRQGAGNRNAFKLPSPRYKAPMTAKRQVLDSIRFNLSSLFTNDNLAPLLFERQPHVIKKWCQMLCLIQNVGELHREIGHYVNFGKCPWLEALTRHVDISNINNVMHSNLYRFLLSPKTSLDLKQHLWDALADVIAYGLTMIDQKSWEPFVRIESANGEQQRNKKEEKKEDKTVYGNELYCDDVYNNDAYGDDVYAIDSSKQQDKQTPTSDAVISRDERKSSQSIPIVVLKTFDKEKKHQLVEMDLFRMDRDRFSIFLPLSRFIVHLVAIYCQTFCHYLVENMKRVNGAQKKHTYDLDEIKLADDDYDRYIQVYVEQFMKVRVFIGQSQNSIWNLTGSIVKSITNYYHVSHLYLHLKGSDYGGLLQALDYLGPSTFMTKLLYLYQLHNW